MSFTEELSDKEDHTLSKVFGKQKVKLYEIKHFIFDFGGVMVNKTFVLKNLFSIIEADLNIRISKKEEDPFIKKLLRKLSSGVISAREFLEKLLNKYYNNNKTENCALPQKKVNISYYLEIWFNLYSQLTKLSSEMELIIERLHNAGYIVSLMSNTFEIHAKSNQLKGFFDIFDNVFLSNEIGLIKPDMDKYKYVLHKLDTDPKKCIFIDDKLRNLIPARELGIIVFKFESIEKFKRQLKQLGIANISKDFWHLTKKKYKQYYVKKKEYKLAKKNYKKAKKEYLEKKKKSIKRKNQFIQKRADYMKKKSEFKQEKKKKKDLIKKI